EASSRVTYTSILSDYEEPSDVGSPRVVVYGYDGFPMHLVDPSSPDYVPGLEEPEQAPLSPDYVPGPEYPKYLALSDEEVPMEDQPYNVADLPIALSSGYIADSDPEVDPEDESEDGPTDYLADGDDDDDDDDDDVDEEEASEEDEDEEEKEHLAPGDSTDVASPVVDPVPSAEETEPFKTDESAATPPPPPAYRTTAKMSIRVQTPIPFPSEAKVDRLLVIPTPPPSPLTLLSSPLPQIPSPPFLIPSPPTTSPTYTAAPLGYRAVGIWLRTASPPPLPLSSPLPLSPPIILPRTRASMVLMRATALSTYILAPRSRTPPSGTPPILPIPLPTSSLPLPLPSTHHRVDVPEAMLSPQKRLCIALGPKFEVGECSSFAAAMPTRGFRADYGFVGNLDAEIRRDLDREDTDEIYVRHDDAQSDRSLMTGQLNVLCRNRLYHAKTALLVEREDRRIEDSDRLTQHIQHEHDRFREFQRTRDVAPEDADRVADALVEHEIQRNNNLNGDRSQGSRSGITRPVRPTRECTYTDFLKCQPMNFKGTEGVVGLTQWFKRMETVFNISNCAVENQVKFATCTLHGVALTWWKSYVKTVGHDAAYGRSSRLIHGSVMASKPKTMQDAVEFATKLMDKKIHTFFECRTKNKRKFEDTSRNNHNQQQQNKRQNTGRAYTAGPSEKREYGGSLPKCSKSSGNANTGNNQRTTRANQRVNGCYKCDAQGHFKRECPKLKNNNRYNQGGNGNAPSKVYVVGNAGTNSDSNVVTGTFLLNNRYASILFNTGADRSFVSTAFSSLIDITPTTLDHYYDVELANGKINGINTIIWGCTLNLLNIPFRIETLIVRGDESNWGNET
ncbi:putative reverse transcriptase domain-containing protein, partial [Tanacetum coccineum]